MPVDRAGVRTSSVLPTVWLQGIGQGTVPARGRGGQTRLHGGHG